MPLTFFPQDGRLKVNDQLLEVNEEVLEGLSNAEAMEKLRTAMQKDKPKQGFIHLVVARRKGGGLGASTTSVSIREERVSQTSDVNPDDKQTSSDKTSDSLPPVSSKSLTENATEGRPASLSVNKARNPVLERLTGLNVNNIRNESYQRATHDSLNESTDSANSDKVLPVIPSRVPNNNGMTISSPTLNANRGETVLIEGDNYQVQMVHTHYILS